MITNGISWWTINLIITDKPKTNTASLLSIVINNILFSSNKHSFNTFRNNRQPTLRQICKTITWYLAHLHSINQTQFHFSQTPIISINKTNSPGISPSHKQESWILNLQTSTHTNCLLKKHNFKTNSHNYTVKSQTKFKIKAKSNPKSIKLRILFKIISINSSPQLFNHLQHSRKWI